MAVHWRFSVLILSTLAIVAQGFFFENNECKQEIVETIPDGITDLPVPAGTVVVPTHESLIEMVNSAEKTIRIASLHLALTPKQGPIDHRSVKPGQMLLDAIVQAARRGVDTEIVVDYSLQHLSSNKADLKAIKEAGGRVKYLNLAKLNGEGLMHSRFMIVDNKTFYVGSANFDWKSYTQTKEIGVTIKNCERLAKDMDKLYRIYAKVSGQTELPLNLPSDHIALTNLDLPLELKDSRLSLGASPPLFIRRDFRTTREQDINSLLAILDSARHSIDVSVDDYSPLSENHAYWPVLEDALWRAINERGVRVRLLFSKWSRSKPDDLARYKKLNTLSSLQSSRPKGSIHVKLFEVPAFDDFQKNLPYGRVKHDKYVVTDNALYVGTSNWAPWYFNKDCGVGFLIRALNEKFSPNTPPQIVPTMQALFERDFNSQYAHELE